MTSYDTLSLAEDDYGSEQMNFENDTDDIGGMPSSSTGMIDSDEESLNDSDDLINDMEYGDLEGYQDLNSNYGEIDEADSLFVDPLAAKQKTRPAHYSRTTRAAERAAIRTQVNESDSFLIVEDGEDYSKPPSREPGTFGRRARAQGDCLPAYSKKISAELDSDDEMLMQMREKGFTDGQISERLAKEGRVRYDRKSISTRIGRIRLAKAAAVDHLIEAGYKEWQLEDDIRLVQAYELANIEVNYEIERARAWRFRKVSDYMRRLDKGSIFSEKACRERYQAIMSGTAKIPVVEDDNPGARRAELEVFQQRREQQRVIEQVTKERKVAMDRKVKEEARFRNAEKSEAVARQRAEKQDERARRAMQRAAQSQMKLQRAQDNKAAKVQRLEQIRAQKAAEKKAQEKHNRGANDNAKYNLNVIKDLKTVTQDTPDPRSCLSFVNLQSLCKERNLTLDGRNKEELVRRLRDADDVYGLQQLKPMCRTKGLNTTGTKLQLKYQLALSEARKFASFGDQEEQVTNHIDLGYGNGEAMDTQ